MQPKFQLQNQALTAIHEGDLAGLRALTELVPIRTLLSFKPQAGNNLLMVAATLGRLEIAEFLIDQGQNIDDKSKNGETALSRACYYNRLEMVRLLLKRGASIEGKDLLGATPFQIAIFRNKPDIVNLLAEAGCNLNLKTNNKELEEQLKQNLEKHELLRKVIALHQRQRRLLPILKAYSKRDQSKFFDKKNFERVNKNVLNSVLKDYL